MFSSGYSILPFILFLLFGSVELVEASAATLPFDRSLAEEKAAVIFAVLHEILSEVFILVLFGVALKHVCKWNATVSTTLKVLVSPHRHERCHRSRFNWRIMMSYHALLRLTYTLMKLFVRRRTWGRDREGGVCIYSDNRERDTVRCK